MVWHSLHLDVGWGRGAQLPERCSLWSQGLWGVTVLA